MSKIKLNIILIIENIILWFPKVYMIMLSMLAANLDDFLVPPTELQKFMYVAAGLVGALLVDTFINFIMYKLLNRKEKNVTYKKLILVSTGITLVTFTILSLL